MATDARPMQINIEDEMRTSFLDYAMSVIIARALPDVRVRPTLGDKGIVGCRYGCPVQSERPRQLTGCRQLASRRQHAVRDQPLEVALDL